MRSSTLKPVPIYSANASVRGRFGVPAMRTSVLLILASVVLGSCVTLPPSKKAPFMFEHVSSTPYIGDLVVDRYIHSGNQMSVLLVKDPASETIAYHTYFNVGSSDEVEGKTGLAHLFEHDVQADRQVRRPVLQQDP